VTSTLPDVIRGSRVDLVLLAVDALLSRDGVGEPLPLPYDDPHDVLNPERSPLLRRIAQVRADPSVNPWLIRLAVNRASATIVGLANFHDRPDAAGMVEIGYSVLPPYRRHGYGHEIATTMWDGVADRADVHILRATISPGNVASLVIVEAAGLVHVGEQDDPDDGLELIYEITTEAYRARST